MRDIGRDYRFAYLRMEKTFRHHRISLARRSDLRHLAIRHHDRQDRQLSQSGALWRPGIIFRRIRLVVDHYVYSTEMGEDKDTATRQDHGGVLDVL